MRNNIARVNLIHRRTGQPPGYPRHAVEQFDEEVDVLDQLEVPPPHAVSPRLLGCWIDAHVPAAEIEAITTLATSVLEDADKAVKWLSEVNLATDNRAPIELIGEAQGFERVKNLLLRIEYGVLA